MCKCSNACSVIQHIMCITQAKFGLGGHPANGFHIHFCALQVEYSYKWAWNGGWPLNTDALHVFFLFSERSPRSWCFLCWWFVSKPFNHNWTQLSCRNTTSTGKLLKSTFRSPDALPSWSVGRTFLSLCINYLIMSAIITFDMTYMIIIVYLYRLGKVFSRKGPKEWEKQINFLGSHLLPICLLLVSLTNILWQLALSLFVPRMICSRNVSQLVCVY